MPSAPLVDIDNRCRPRSDVAEWGVWSEVHFFAEKCITLKKKENYTLKRKFSGPSDKSNTKKLINKV